MTVTTDTLRLKNDPDGDGAHFFCLLCYEEKCDDDCPAAAIVTHWAEVEKQRDELHKDLESVTLQLTAKISEARADAAALRAALEDVIEEQGSAECLADVRATLASDAGRAALDAVKLAAREAQELPIVGVAGERRSRILAALRAAFGEDPGVD